ncbi:MAG: hypothetical protein N3E37_00730 [Candidatus Micrarchaeota archaeon]|nr:hypothetical protein [Candidatus Micrarchaeota archaeon]
MTYKALERKLNLIDKIFMIRYYLLLVVVVSLLSVEITYPVKHELLKYINMQNSRETEIKVRNTNYYWIYANDVDLLFKNGNETEDIVVTDEYEAMYVLKTYYNQKYLQSIDSIINYVTQFNDSRRDREFNCKNMLGHYLYDCNDLYSCYKACYYHPNCQFGLIKVYTANMTNANNQTESVIIQTLKPLNQSDIVEASYALSVGTKNLDKLVERVIKKLSTFRESFQFKFDIDNDLVQILGTIRTINDNPVFDKNKLNYCRKIDYPVGFINSAISMSRTIEDKEIDINATAKRMVEKANYYLSLLRKEKGEEQEAIFNLTNKYEQIFLEFNQTLSNAIQKFRYAKYFEIRENLESLYDKIKNAKSYSEALNFSQQFDNITSTVNDTVQKTEQKVQRINLLRNAALNSALNAEKDNYNAKVIIQELERIDRLLKKERITDSDIVDAITTLEKIKSEEFIKSQQNQEELNIEKLLNDYLIFIIAFAVIVLGIIAYMSRNLIFKQKPGITTIVYKNAQNLYETTLSVKLEKDNNPLPDGTPVTFFVGKGAEVGNTYIQNSYAHATLTFEEFPKEDMDIKIVTTDVEVKLKLHFVPSEDLQREMMTEKKKKTLFDQVLENINVKK